MSAEKAYRAILRKHGVSRSIYGFKKGALSLLVGNERRIFPAKGGDAEMILLEAAIGRLDPDLKGQVDLEDYSAALKKEAKMQWQPIETAPKDDYVTILVAVPRYEERALSRRLAMWDPENGDWTVFGANWNPAPVFWMPLPDAPPMPDGIEPTMISDRLRSDQQLR